MTANDSTAPAILDFQKEFNEDGTPFTPKDYVSWVIGTTIDWSLHPDKQRHELHQLAEKRLLGLIALLELRPSDPPVGKDSSFEELLTRLLELRSQLSVASYVPTPESEHDWLNDQFVAARSALVALFAKQREAIERLITMFANSPDIEEAPEYKALQSELARQREESKNWEESANANYEDFKAANDEIASLAAQLERQRETTLTPAQASEAFEICEYASARGFYDIDQELIRKLRLLSSPKQSAPEENTK